MIGRNRGVSILPPVKGHEAREEQTDWYRGTADAVYKNLDYVQYHQLQDILILSGDHIFIIPANQRIHRYTICYRITLNTLNKFMMTSLRRIMASIGK